MKMLMVVVGVVFLGGVAHAQLPGMPSVPSIPGTGGSTPSLPGGLGADCGKVSGTAAGVRLKAFLAATAELEKASASLEASVKDACVAMGKELGIPTAGDTKTVCANVSKALKAGLKASVKGSAKVKTKVTPPQCTVKADFAAELAAKCEGKATADIKATCSGTCRGACNGTCAVKDASGQCAGKCSGTCSGKCEGSANVDASAQCKASAQARANMKAECTPAKVEVVADAAMIVDASGFEKAKKAIEVGLPALLAAGAKAKLVKASVVLWTAQATKLAKGGLSLGKELGAASMCVAGDLAAAAKASANVSARVNVSVSASASVSGAAGGSVK